MNKFVDFKDWYLNDGTTEDLQYLSKVEIVDGVLSLREIKQNLVVHQKWELATIARATERTLMAYLGIDRVDMFGSAPKKKYRYDSISFNTENEIFDYIRKYENRQNGINGLLDNSIDSSIS